MRRDKKGDINACHKKVEKETILARFILNLAKNNGIIRKYTQLHGILANVAYYFVLCHRSSF